jgi:NAD(P)-dependent dehydrogenase (short-subunit alcohol dehydrogenase family)
MDISLENKVVVIAGPVRGMGLTPAQMALQSGAKVAGSIFSATG